MSCSLHYCMYVIHYYYVVVSCLYVRYITELSCPSPDLSAPEIKSHVLSHVLAWQLMLPSMLEVVYKGYCDRYIINMK
jgi:hypothetical protein